MMAATWWVRREWGLGAAVIAATSMAQIGFAEQPLKQLPEDVVSFSFAWVALPQAITEVTRDHGLLAGISWGVLKGSSEAVERVVNLMDEARPAGPLPRSNTDRSPAWLNSDNGRSRRTRREPALVRYTF